MKNLSRKTSASSSHDPNRSALFGGRNASRSPSASGSRYDNLHTQQNDQCQDPYARDLDVQRSSRPTYRPSRGHFDETADTGRKILFRNRSLPPLNRYDNSDRSAQDGNFSVGPRRFDEYRDPAQIDDEDIEAIKQEIRFTKQESLSSTRNAIRIASEAEETGRTMLFRLGLQSEKLSEIEKDVDVSAAYVRTAEENARELRRLNRSIFAVHLSNPLKRSSSREAEEAKIRLRHEMERQEGEQNRQRAYDSARRVRDALNKPSKANGENPVESMIPSRGRYTFEEDDEDIQMEKDIDANLDTLGDITSRLKGLALATRAEIEAQNTRLDQVAEKVCSP